MNGDFIDASIIAAGREMPLIVTRAANKVRTPPDDPDPRRVAHKFWRVSGTEQRQRASPRELRHVEWARIVSDDESAGSEEREKLRDGGLAHEINDRQVSKSATHKIIRRRAGDCHPKASLQKFHRELSIVLKRPPAHVLFEHRIRSARRKDYEVGGRTV